MLGHIKVQYLTHHRLNLLDSRITELQYFITILADKMIMLFIGIGFFEHGQVLTKLMPRNKVTGKQMFNCIIKCGTADMVLFLLHPLKKLVNIKMILQLVYLSKYGKSFRCLV